MQGDLGAWCSGTVEGMCTVRTRGVNNYSGKVKTEAECW